MSASEGAAPPSALELLHDLLAEWRRMAARERQHSLTEATRERELSEESADTLDTCADEAEEIVAALDAEQAQLRQKNEALKHAVADAVATSEAAEARASRAEAERDHVQAVWRRKSPQAWADVILGDMAAAAGEFSVGEQEAARDRRNFTDVRELLEAVTSWIPSAPSARE